MAAVFTSRGHHNEEARNGWLKKKKRKRKTEINCLTVLEGGILRLRCRQGWFLLGSLAENLFHALSRAPGGLAFLGL